MPVVKIFQFSFGHNLINHEIIKYEPYANGKISSF